MRRMEGVSNKLPSHELHEMYVKQRKYFHLLYRQALLLIIRIEKKSWNGKDVVSVFINSNNLTLLFKGGGLGGERTGRKKKRTPVHRIPSSFGNDINIYIVLH